MRIHSFLSVVSFALFVLPWAAHPRALPPSIINNCDETGCNDAHNSRSLLQGSDTLQHPSGRINLLTHEPAGATFLDILSEPIPHAIVNTIRKRAAIRLPKGDKPDSDTAESDQGDSGGFVPGSTKPSESNEPDSGDSGGFSPGTSTPKGDTEDADLAELCKRSADGLWSRADCQPGSGDDGPGGGGFDSEPPEVATPGFDRKTVKNWYDVVEQTPKPPFRANDEFDRRLNSDEPDQPIADFSGRYKLRGSSEVSDMFSSTRFALGQMQKTLKREAPGPGVNLKLQSQPGSKVFQEATFSSDGKMIVADFSLKSGDSNSPANQVPWNQLLFKQYKDVMDKRNGGNLLNLQSIGRSEILSVPTRKTIETAMERTGQKSVSYSEVATFRADAAPGTEEAKAFEALCRTDNVNGVLYLLSDYHQALGNKRITNIHVATEKGDVAYNMIIDIA